MQAQQNETLPPSIKLSDLATWSGFTERYLRDLSTAGTLPPINRSELPFDAVPRLFAYLRRDSEELIRQKLLRATADRKIAEVEASKVEGKFRSVEVFNRTLIAFGQAVNRAITAGEKPLQKSLCSALPGVMEHQVKKAVETALDKLRTEIATAIDTAEEPANGTEAV